MSKKNLRILPNKRLDVEKEKRSCDSLVPNGSLSDLVYEKFANTTRHTSPDSFPSRGPPGTATSSTGIDPSEETLGPDVLPAPRFLPASLRLGPAETSDASLAPRPGSTPIRISPYRGSTPPGPAPPPSRPRPAPARLDPRPTAKWKRRSCSPLDAPAESPERHRTRGRAVPELPRERGGPNVWEGGEDRGHKNVGP